MTRSLIYVLEGGDRDYSRWLNMTCKDGVVTLHLADLCHPGRVSALDKVPCELEALRDATIHGAVQITVPNGYLMYRRDGDRIEIEFKGHSDRSHCNVSVDASEVLTRIESFASPATVAV